MTYVHASDKIILPREEIDRSFEQEREKDREIVRTRLGKPVYKHNNGRLWRTSGLACNIGNREKRNKEWQREKEGETQENFSANRATRRQNSVTKRSCIDLSFQTCVIQIVDR